jgi:hypothetical protein
MRECPACGDLIDPDREAIGSYCCPRREQRVESGRIGYNTQVENGRTPSLSNRLSFGFYLMNWSEQWERKDYGAYE